MDTFNKKPATISLMTLIVALKSKDGVVMAGDKRVILDTSYSYNDNSVKVFSVNNRVAIGGAGEGYDVNEVIQEVLKQAKHKDVDEVKELACTLAREKQAQWYTPSNQYLVNMRAAERPNFSLIIAGYTHQGEQKLYSFTASTLSPHLHWEGYHQEGITTRAADLFKQKYTEDLTTDALKELVSEAIKKTSDACCGVSNSFDLISIKTPSTPQP